jgi:hypothetical protein
LACTFNPNTSYVDEDAKGLTIRQYPVVARLLFQYARKMKDMDWLTWSQRVSELDKTYADNLLQFLALEAVVRFLKQKYSKSKAVLLIDETHQFVQGGKYTESDLLMLMKSIISIQDLGVAVIFSVFVPLLAAEEARLSTRQVVSLNMTELSLEDVTKILSVDQIKQYLTPLSNALGLNWNQTMELLYSCFGGLPRVVVDGLSPELMKQSFDLLQVIDAVGKYIVSQYPPP